MTETKFQGRCTYFYKTHCKNCEYFALQAGDEPLEDGYDNCTRYPECFGCPMRFKDRLFDIRSFRCHCCVNVTAKEKKENMCKFYIERRDDKE